MDAIDEVWNDEPVKRKERRRGMKKERVFLFRFVLVAASLIAWPSAVRPQDSTRWNANVPKTWDGTSLQDWATPVAGLNIRPTHLSPDDYYALPIENLRMYPVYLPGREPADYWETLQRVGPKPLIGPPYTGPQM